MDFIHSIILGAVQGISEFLPISSSAHLVLVPYLFKWQDQGLIFDVALHFGTLLAIIIFFWKDWISIIARAISHKKQDTSNPSTTLEAGKAQTNLKPQILNPNEANLASKANEAEAYPKNLLWILLVATIPGAIAGALLEKQAETIFRSPLLIAINLIVFGLIIWLIDKYSKKNYQLSAINFKLAFYVGLAQMLAIIPGVSRSGSTMSAGRIIGLNRPDSARFSFLLAAPIMLGSALFEARHLTNLTLNASFYIGIISSMIFGLIAIKYLLQYLQKGNYAIFTWYRVILALIVIIVFLIRSSN
jgi:undecaprenyl-diphosphatase